MLLAGNLELFEVDIRRGIFQGASLSYLPLALELVLLSLILRNAKVATELSESKEKTIYLLFKVYGKSEKE